MKWKPLRAAAVLFILTALTSNVICGTLAKYTVSASSQDSARVAKWGVTIFSEGSLFGENYDGTPSNTVTENADGSVTVKSHHEVSLGSGTTTRNVVAPGTENQTGLVFGFSGKPETAIKVDVTIRNQNITLRPNIYYILHKVKEPVTADNFEALKATYGKLYKKSEQNFVVAGTFEDAVGTYYYADNETNLSGAKYWIYCPVVFELTPAGEAAGMTVTETFNAATPISDSYRPSFKDKSLDLVAMSAMWCGFDGGSTWPVMNDKNVFSRTVSHTFAANTDLSKITLNNLAEYSMENECLTWKWKFQQEETPDLYNNADNILGRLAAEKLANGLDDHFVVIHDREIGTFNGHLEFTQKSGDTLIRPVEYKDYCLETMFDFEMTVTQID